MNINLYCVILYCIIPWYKCEELRSFFLLGLYSRVELPAHKVCENLTL